MQKNYLTKMVKSMINPFTSTSKNWKKSTTTWLVALFMLCGVSDTFGQIAQRGVATTATGNNVSTLTIKKPFVDFV